MLMHNPHHPGEALRRLRLKPLGLSITEAAKGLGISRNTLSAIVQAEKQRKSLRVVKLAA